MGGCGFSPAPWLSGNKILTWGLLFISIAIFSSASERVVRSGLRKRSDAPSDASSPTELDVLTTNFSVTTLPENVDYSGGNGRLLHKTETEIAEGGEKLLYIAISVALILCSGAAAGLTTGFLSLDPIQLRVKELEGSPADRKSASRILKLLKSHHRLLVTLLLLNSICMEALPIFLDKVVPAAVAVILSVTAILIFGEVLPQAICTGPQQFRIAAWCCRIVELLMLLMCIVAWPISKALDCFLGHGDQHLYARSHLKALIRMHERDSQDAAPETAGEEASSGGQQNAGLIPDEVVVIEGALDLATKTLGEIMVPLPNVNMIEINTKITHDVLKRILKHGHSRIPVYEGNRHNVRGLMMVKSLLTINQHCPDTTVRTVMSKRGVTPLFASQSANLYDMLNEFQKGKSHIAIITTHPGEYYDAVKEKRSVNSTAKVLGIATLEDVIEELIQEEILDEFDPQKVWASQNSEGGPGGSGNLSEGGVDKPERAHIRTTPKMGPIARSKSRLVRRKTAPQLPLLGASENRTTSNVRGQNEMQLSSMGLKAQHSAMYRPMVATAKARARRLGSSSTNVVEAGDTPADEKGQHLPRRFRSAVDAVVTSIKDCGGGEKDFRPLPTIDGEHGAASNELGLAKSTPKSVSKLPAAP